MGRTTIRRALAMAAVVTAGAVAVPAAQARELTVTTTGALTISWTAEPSLGCAAAGLCGVTGVIEILPGGSSSGSGGPVPIELMDFQSAARVIRRGADGTVAWTCADVVPVDLSLSVRRTPQGLRAVAVGQPFQGPSSGRCAGPTAVDLEALTLPARRFGAHSYDLSGTTTFMAGPFAVTAASSVKALITTGSSSSGVLGILGGGFSTSSGSGPGTPPKLHRALEETASVQYRVTGVSGGFAQTFAGLAPPLCAGLGACGSSGTLTETIAGLRSIGFEAGRIVRRAVGRGTALADLRGGRLRLSDVPLTTPAMGSVTETMTDGGGVGCRDQLSAGEFFPMPAARRRGPIVIQLTSSGIGTPDPLRTRCPGPAAVDVIGAASVLGTAVLPANELGDARLTLTFTRSGAFSGHGYTGSRNGSLVLTLQRVAEHGGTHPSRLFTGQPGVPLP